jgi:hypothetical protein
MSPPDIPRLPRTAKAYIHKLEERVAADAQLIVERDARIDELSFPRFFAFQRPGVMQPYPLSAEPQASLA